MGKYVVGITGASGSIYGIRLVQALIKMGNEVFLVITDQGKKVLEYELELSLESVLSNMPKEKVTVCADDDFFLPIASGSFKVDGMVIIPCSMGSLGKIANGISDSLLTRSADVSIKEKRKLILVPRETPLSQIHLENLLKLSKIGVDIIPPIPEFYSKPKSIEDIVHSTVGRILDGLGVDNELYSRWGSDKTISK